MQLFQKPLGHFLRFFCLLDALMGQVRSPEGVEAAEAESHTLLLIFP